MVLKKLIKMVILIWEMSGKKGSDAEGLIFRDVQLDSWWDVLV